MKPLAERLNLPLYTDYQHSHTGVRDFFDGCIFTIGGGENADKDRAAAIVTALNAHDPVVQALKDAKFALETVRNLTGNDTLTAYINQAKKALNLAGEG